MKKLKFIDFLEQVCSFTAKEKELIIHASEIQTLSKGQYLLEMNEVCKHVHFVLKGVIRFYILNDKGDELTTTFLSEGELVARIESFLKNAPSNGYLQCETSCELISISKENYVELYKISKRFGYAMSQLVSLSVAKKMEIQRRLLTEDGKESFLDFNKFHKNIANRIPSNHIASYLGMTPSSLSRVKKELTHF